MERSETSLVRGGEAFQERARIIKSAVAMELIFNTHGSVEEARQSASQIEPSSVVFLEGTRLNGNSDPEKTVSLTHAAAALSTLHLEKGVESAEYLEYKDFFLADMAEMITAGAEEDNLWSFAMHQALIAKDCIVFPADLIHAKQDTTIPPEVITTLEHGERALGRTALSLTDQTIRPGRAWREALKIHQQYIAYQHFREAICVFRVTAYLTELIEVYPDIFTQLHTAEDGKLSSYAVWGTAHAHSLSEAFQQADYQINTTILNERQGIRFIIPDTEKAFALAPVVALSDILDQAIRITAYAQVDHCLTWELTNHLAHVEPKVLFAMYIRTFQLYKSIDKTFTQFETGIISKEDMEVIVTSDLYNLYGILNELGLDAASYIMHPYNYLYEQ